MIDQIDKQSQKSILLTFYIADSVGLLSFSIDDSKIFDPSYLMSELSTFTFLLIYISLAFLNDIKDSTNISILLSKESFVFYVTALMF